MADYRRAPEVQAIARDLIDTIEQHKTLASVRIEYVWRDKAAKSKGRTVLAKARKIGGLNAFLALAVDEATQFVEGLDDEGGEA